LDFAKVRKAAKQGPSRLVCDESLLCPMNE
jgi:hypothetical protein